MLKRRNVPQGAFGSRVEGPRRADHPLFGLIEIEADRAGDARDSTPSRQDDAPPAAPETETDDDPPAKHWPAWVDRFVYQDARPGLELPTRPDPTLPPGLKLVEGTAFPLMIAKGDT
jgi:hypothetical protein